MAMLIANLQAVAPVLTISVAVKDDAGVPGEWLRQANHELQRIYSEIDVNIVLWDPSQPSSRSDQATVPRNHLTIAIRRNALALQTSFPTTQWSRRRTERAQSARFLERGLQPTGRR
jgi:hypothetical protein